MSTKKGTKAETLKGTGKLKHGKPSQYGKGRSNYHDILGPYPKSQKGQK